MWMQLEWTEDEAILHVVWKGNRVEVRGSRAIFTDREPIGDPIAMLLSTLPRPAVNVSALMADDVAGVRKDYIPDVISWLDWHERVTCWFDGEWMGR